MEYSYTGMDCNQISNMSVSVPTTRRKASIIPYIWLRIRTTRTMLCMARLNTTAKVELWTVGACMDTFQTLLCEYGTNPTQFRPLYLKYYPEVKKIHICTCLSTQPKTCFVVWHYVVKCIWNPFIFTQLIVWT